MDDDRITFGDENSSRTLATRRHASFFAISVAFHAALIAAVVMLVPAVERPRNEQVLAYFVEPGSGGAGGGAGHSASGAAPQHHDEQRAYPKVIAEVAQSLRKHHRKPATPLLAARPVDTAPITPVASASARPMVHSIGLGNSGAGTSRIVASIGGTEGAGVGDRKGRGADEDGTGNGAGNPGDALAHADYGADPPPPYPSHSRRDGEEGTVMLHVLVGSDGAVKRVELAQSSGFDALDDAALTTVRERWRFVPARHDGVPTESWVLVPIRFALTEANANQ